MHWDNSRTSLERSDESARRPSMWPGFFPGLDFIRWRSLLVLYPDLGDYFSECSSFSPLARNPKFDFIYWDLDWLVVPPMTTATARLNTLRLKWSDKYYKATLKFTLIFLQITDEELGCFSDKTAQRAFPTLVKNLRPEINWQYLERTIQKCALLSKQQNFKVKDANTVIWFFFCAPFLLFKNDFLKQTSEY